MFTSLSPSLPPSSLLVSASKRIIMTAASLTLRRCRRRSHSGRCSANCSWRWFNKNVRQTSVSLQLHSPAHSHTHTHSEHLPQHPSLSPLYCLYPPSTSALSPSPYLSLSFSLIVCHCPHGILHFALHFFILFPHTSLQHASLHLPPPHLTPSPLPPPWLSVRPFHFDSFSCVVSLSIVIVFRRCCCYCYCSCHCYYYCCCCCFHCCCCAL